MGTKQPAQIDAVSTHVADAETREWSRAARMSRRLVASVAGTARVRARGTPLARARRHLLAALATPIIDRYGWPRLAEIVGADGSVWLDAEALVAHLTASSAPLTDVRLEYALLSRELESRQRAMRATPYPLRFAVNDNTSFLLYAVVRREAPLHVLETGVANGRSSFFILQAMARNGRGTLHSTEVGRQAGQLVGRDERDRWDLRVLNRGSVRRAFAGSVGALPDLDVFVHDSDHSFSWQSFEYQTIVPRVLRGGLIMSDDIDASYAFAHLCRKHRWDPHVLVGEDKLFGAVRIG